MSAPDLRTVFRWGAAATAGAVAVLIAVLGIWTVRNILVLALVALFVAVSLDPAVRWLVRHGVKRPWAVTLIFLIAAGLVALVILLIGPPLVQEARQISADIPGYVSGLDDRSKTFRELSERYGLAEHLNQLAKDLPGRIGSSALDFFRRFVGVLASTLVVVVLAIYFMADMPRIRRVIPLAAPRAYRERTAHVADVVVDKVGSYMIGGLAVSSVAAIVTYISLTILDVPFALPLALVVFITAFIPMIGATLGAVICVVVAAVTNGLWPTAVIVLLVFVVYQQLENYLIAPRVMQKTVDLPAVGVLLAGMIGGTMLGLIGALMAIPIAAAIKAVLVEVRSESGQPAAKEPGHETAPSK